LCLADNDFPIRLWDKLLPQAVITLNLMRASQTDPTKSAYKVVFGPFDHNQTPPTPPGCKVLIHEKPSQRRSWDLHRAKGWYLGPALEHYHCHCCYVINMQAEHISNTVEFLPRQAPTPTITSTEAAIIAAEALIRALNNPTVRNNTEALCKTANNTLNQLSKVYEIKTDPAAPRVAEPPRVAPGARVAAEPTDI
jgi:hypothetical protein